MAGGQSTEMSANSPALLVETSAGEPRARTPRFNVPISVREAALYLGVSTQTVYLWVERKQIPHLRVMGRNIRFLKSDLEPFRAQFKQEVDSGTTA
jgi:excisionase family DNA binding protein